VTVVEGVGCVVDDDEHPVRALVIITDMRSLARVTRLSLSCGFGM